MADQTRKLIILGIDCGTFEVISPLIEQGKLSNFKYLMENGSYGILQSTLPPISPAAWSSFATGQSPFKHGVFDFIKLNLENFENELVDSSYVMQRAFWNHVNNSGKTVGLFNVPMTYPPVELNGYHISGLMTPSVSGEFTRPAEMKEALFRIDPKYCILPDMVLSDQNRRQYAERVYEMIEGKERIIKYLLENHECDLNILVFNEIDTIQHGFWGESEVLERFYQKADQMLGYIINKYGKQVNIIIMSDHGANPNENAFFANRYLRDVGLLHFKRNPIFLTKYLFNKIGFHQNAYRIMTFFRLNWIQNHVRLPQKQDIMNAFVTFRDVDWERTKVYGNGMFGQLYVNLKGREKQGIVDGERKYRELIEYLKDLLRNDLPKKDKKIESVEVYSKMELGDDNIYSQSPDVIVKLNDYRTISSLKFGLDQRGIIGEPDYHNNFGTHSMEGIFVAWGADIRKGEKVNNAEIIDIAPTVLYLMGEKIPKRMDGKVLESVITEEYCHDHQIQYLGSDEEKQVESKEKNQMPLTKGEEAELRERLKNLGYLE